MWGSGWGRCIAVLQGGAQRLPCTHRPADCQPKHSATAAQQHGSVTIAGTLLLLTIQSAPVLCAVSVFAFHTLCALPIPFSEPQLRSTLLNYSTASLAYARPTSRVLVQSACWQQEKEGLQPYLALLDTLRMHPSRTEQWALV